MSSSPYSRFTHLKCKCGGIIGMYDRKHYICERCKEEQNVIGRYDHIEVNPKTGWVFPMIKRNEV